MIYHIQLSPGQAALLALVTLLLYGTCLVAYRLLFHPLARFPGPKLAAASKWYEFWFDLIQGDGGRFMFEIDRMHDKYGTLDVVAVFFTASELRCIFRCLVVSLVLSSTERALMLLVVSIKRSDCTHQSG